MLSWKIGGASTSMNKAEPCHNACDTVYLRLSLVEPYGMDIVVNEQGKALSHVCDTVYLRLSLVEPYGVDIVMVYFGEGAVHIISGYTFGS